MAQVKKFSNGIMASVVLLDKGRQLLEIGDYGILAIPTGMTPNAFCLILHAEEKARVVFAQKNVGQDMGGYNDSFSKIEIVGTQVFSPPIQVMRAGENVWTLWHSEKPNRMDCWTVENDGRLELFQIGVITHNDGQTFQLLGELRWQGQILKGPAGKLVAKPSNPKWGPLLWNEGESRAGIRENPDFQDLLANADLLLWKGSPEELNPPLSPIPSGNFARVDWYIPFAHQKGGGIAKDEKGASYVVHGQDVGSPPDADGIRRLWHNDLISYILVHENWGTKKGQPKLLGIKMVSEKR